MDLQVVQVTAALHPTMRRAIYREPPARILARRHSWRQRAKVLIGDASNAVLVWSGPSQWNGEPVVVIATGIHNSSNPKTGPVVQFYILPERGDPKRHVDEGTDATVCGDCIHRPSEGGDCYVSTQWAPRNLLTALRRGAVRAAPPSLFDGAYVRLGAWGDPAMVPLHVWQPIVRGAAQIVGYTQQWHNLPASEWGFLMASCEDEATMRHAQSTGWRTFRVLYEDDVPLDGESECLATAAHIPCIACGGCDGRSARPSYYIRAHGTRAGG